MKGCIFLAGASGAIGRRLAPLLIADGWRVVGTTRKADKAALLKQMGVEPVIVDVFDAPALNAAVVAAHPDVVIHQLTDLPYALKSDELAAALVRNARIRDEGTRNLISAAVSAGARRLIAQSISLIYAPGPQPHSETDPLIPENDSMWGGTVRGVVSLERQVLAAPMEGIVLRYGMLYGPNTGFDSSHGPGSIHVDAAAKAAELAVTQGTRGIYNIADEDGAITSQKAIQSLGWNANWRA